LATKQPLGGLPFIKDARSLRESSWDRTGENRDFKVVEPGETCIIADIKGAGCIGFLCLFLFPYLYLMLSSFELHRSRYDHGCCKRMS